MENQSDNHLENNNNRPWLWKKGQSGNLKGRPKGKTMKEWAKDYLARMTDEERDNFMEGIPKEIVWKMGEGNPDSKIDSEVNVKIEKLETIQEATQNILGNEIKKS